MGSGKRGKSPSHAGTEQQVDSAIAMTGSLASLGAYVPGDSPRDGKTRGLALRHCRQTHRCGGTWRRCQLGWREALRQGVRPGHSRAPKRPNEDRSRIWTRERGSDTAWPAICLWPGEHYARRLLRLGRIAAVPREPTARHSAAGAEGHPRSWRIAGFSIDSL